MKIYVVTDYYWDNNCVAVCATQEAADRWIREYFASNEIDFNEARFDITETTVFE